MPPPAIQFWDIQVTEDDSPGRSFKLQEGSLSLGASPDCEIVSSAAGVAPRHAEFSVNDGALRVRIFDGAPPILLNGSPVRGAVDVPCPATIQIGALRAFISHSGPAAAPRQDSESTLRIVHPARSRTPQFTDPDGLDVTGRIVYQLTDPAGASSVQPPPSHPDFQSQKTIASFSNESTMAFSVESLDLEIADKVPVRVDYEVKGEIARGGMGKIYSAEDTELDRLVALKVSTASDRGRDAQFFREARVLAALAHPNIVPIHNLGVDAEGRPFYSMKLIEGRTLQWIIKQLAAADPGIASVYTRERLLDVFRKVCDAVSFAHSKGYLHRDLKPDNIMVGEFGEVLVMDWGLAKIIRRPRVGIAGQGPEEDEPETLPYIEGTPQYMSPEQANGVYGGLDERSDIYSLGGVLYAMLTLRPPVSGSSPNEVLEKVRKGETTTMALPQGSVTTMDPTRVSAVPEALRAVTHKALAREKERRYQSVEAFAADIEAYQNGFATSAETAGIVRHLVLLVRRHRIASGFAAALLAGAVGFTLRLAASERRAVANEGRARESEARARESAARAQIALAEAAEQNLNAQGTRTALDGVDDDLKNQEWRYLKGASNSAAWTREINSAEYPALVPNPEDSGVLLGLHRDGVMRSINLKSNFTKDICKIEDARLLRFMYGLAISSDGQTAAITTLNAEKNVPGKNSFQIHLVHLEDGKRVPLNASPPGNGPRDMAFSPDGKFLMERYGNGQATLYDTQSRAVLWSKTENWFDLYHFQTTGACRYIKSSKKCVKLDPQTGEDIGVVSEVPLKIHETPWLLSDSKTNNILDFFSGSIRKIDMLNGQLLYENRLSAADWRNVQMSYVDGGSLVVSLFPTLNNSAILQVWDGVKGDLLKSIPIEIPAALKGGWKLLAHPKWRHVAVMRGDTSKAWPTQRVQEDGFYQMNGHITHGFAFGSVPGSFIYQELREEFKDKRATADVAVYMPAEKKPNQTKALKGINNPVSFFSTNRSGERLAFGATSGVYTPSSLRFFKNFEEARLHPPGGGSPISGAPYCFELSPDGSLLWLGNGFYEPSAGKPIHALDRSGIESLEGGESACWVGGSHVAELVTWVAAKSDRRRALALWSLSEAKPRLEEAPNANAVSASPDGALIAEAGGDMRVRIRDGVTLAERKTLRVHDAPVTGVAWHPTLPFLATASKDYTVKIWNLETEVLAEEIGLFRGVPGKLYWSPDGKTLGVRTDGTGDRGGISLFTPKLWTPAGK